MLESFKNKDTTKLSAHKILSGKKQGGILKSRLCAPEKGRKRRKGIPLPETRRFRTKFHSQRGLLSVKFTLKRKIFISYYHSLNGKSFSG